MRSPPMPRIANGAPRRRSSRATLEAWRSPEGSPTTKRISRTSGRAGGMRAPERRQRLLDLTHDAERHRQRIAAIFSRDHHGSLAGDRRDEAVVLQAQRLPFRGLQLDALHELLD